MDFPHGETVTRLRASSSEDEYHNTVEDWATPAELSILGAAVSLAGTFDMGATDRQPTEADFDVILPIGADVTATDRLRIRGEECDIVGRPFEWRSPFTGWAPGMVVRASVREG
jgi:head-tail adaptor